MIGICNLSNIPIRYEPESRSEMTSQLLFGETFRVIEQKNGWIQVLTIDDEYSGWISSSQLEILNTAIHHKFTACTFPFALAISNKGNIMIPAGSTIPDLADKLFIIKDRKSTRLNSSH